MSRATAQRSRLEVFLVLGRVSNLPTVWSNCLAAWLLSGGGLLGHLVLVILGATLLYSGGMFFNDAFDEAFDRQFRPERPIPSGQIERRTVWLAGTAFLGLGWLALLALGTRTGMIGAILVGCIVVYDAVHKQTPWAPLLMCACRLLLYLVAGSAAIGSLTPNLVWHSLALAAYIAGISYLARGESRQAKAPVWSVALLFAPGLLALWVADWGWIGTWLAEGVLVGWSLWCLGRAWRKARAFSGGVAGLLAGIVLVDWLAAAGQASNPVVFPALFLLTLLLQRWVPAT